MVAKHRSAKSTLGGSFVGIPHQVLDSPNFMRLTPYACKLLLDLGSQYSGTNNGDLAITFSMMKKRGWKSSATLWHAQCELEHFGFIERTRQGGRNLANLFAFTWRNIDESRRKRLDVDPTNTPSNLWKTSKGELVPIKKKLARQTRTANSRDELDLLATKVIAEELTHGTSESGSSQALH